MSTAENRRKILGVDPDGLTRTLLGIGAVEVCNRTRTITHFDTAEPTMRVPGGRMRLVEGRRTRLEGFSPSLKDGVKVVEMQVGSRLEAEQFLGFLSLVPVTRLQMERIGFGLGLRTDVRLDAPPHIPPYMEVKSNGAPEHDIHVLLGQLGLTDHEQFDGTLPGLYTHYGIDYLGRFAVPDH